MKRLAVVIAAVVALGAASVVEARDRNKDAIAARQAAFTLIAANFGPMSAMAKKKMPFNKDVFAMRAANLEVLSRMPWEFFIPGTDKGKTKAKAKVWTDADDYKAKADGFQQEMARLAEAGRSGDQKAMLAQFKKAAKTCKACHKKYKRIIKK